MNYMLLIDQKDPEKARQRVPLWKRKNHNLRVELIFLFQIMRNTNPEGRSGNSNYRCTFF